MLNEQAERAYATCAESGCSRGELIRRGLPIVRRIAFRMTRRLPSHVQVDDLMGAGAEGLMKAVAAYDPAISPRFEAYAEMRIRGAVLDALRANDSLTRYGRRRMGEVTRTIRRLQTELGRQPTEPEVARALDMGLEDYQRLSANLAQGPALAHLGAHDPDMVASEVPTPEVTLCEAELKHEVAGAIRRLPERKQTVLALYYQEQCTQAEIGRILGVTESRVCQILGEAITSLRAMLGQEPAERRRVPRRAAGK